MLRNYVNVAVRSRTKFGPLVLLTATGVLVVPAVLTIGSQTLRAARADPAKTLRQD